MQFGQYIWKDAPKITKIDGRIHGWGTLTGLAAYEDFKEMTSVFYRNGPDDLTYELNGETTCKPVWWVSMRLEQEPRETVEYSFEFWPYENFG